MRRVFFIGGLLLLFSIPLTFSQDMGQLMFFSHPLVGKQAPAFTLPTPGGQTIASQAIGRKKTILFFWATWCSHCRSELNTLKKEIAPLEKKDIVLLLINIGESPQVVQRYLQQRGMNGQVLLDSDSAVADTYRVVGVPSYFFIDENHIVRDVIHEFPRTDEELAQLFKAAQR